MKIQRCFRDGDHPLILREKKDMKEQVMMIFCRICKRVISEASFYECDLCGYYLHESCTNLPDEITHSFHPHHPLKLSEGMRSFCCDSCWEFFPDDVPLYRCVKCYYFCLDVECALMPAISTPCGEGDEQRILHFSHRHPLLLVEKHGIRCDGCGSTCSGLAYGCNDCDFFLHKSCPEFPQQTRHPLHLDHGSLSLRFWSIERDCFLCEGRHSSGRGRGFFLKCTKRGCSFRLCWSCGKKRVRPVRYEGHHDHDLHLVEKSADTTELAKCNGYEGYCAKPLTANSSEVSRTKSNILVCLDCDFRLHMLCGPLPATVKHEYHTHPLTLLDCLDEDDYDDYYCDVCETERDPRIRFYYCHECKYYAHVHCLLSEIFKVLTIEDYRRDRDMDLKIVGQDLWNFPNSEFKNNENKLIGLTLKDIINKLMEREPDVWQYFYRWDDYTSSKSKGDPVTNLTPQSELVSGQDIDEILKSSHFTDRDLPTFFGIYQYEKLLEKTFPIKSTDLALKTVNVQDYEVPHTVGHVMRALLYKYGDISNDDEGTYSSREWKSIVYFILCDVLRKMRTTRVIDITKGDLQEWHIQLLFVKLFDFKVDFACAHLERLVRAFLGLQAGKIKDQVPAILEHKVTKLQQEIADAKSKLEICKAYPDSSARSQFMIDCLKEASNMKQKTACDLDLLSHCSHSALTDKCWNID